MRPEASSLAISEAFAREIIGMVEEVDRENGGYRVPTVGRGFEKLRKEAALELDVEFRDGAEPVRLG